MTHPERNGMTAPLTRVAYAAGRACYARLDIPVIRRRRRCWSL